MPFPKVLDIVHITPTLRGKEREGSYRVRVAEVHDTSFVTEAPLDAVGIVRWPLGTKAVCVFLSGENLYQFETTLLAREPENIVLYTWQRPNEDRVHRIQRRAYYRVRTALPAEVLIGERRHSVLIVSLSAGGCAFRLPQQVKPGDMLVGSFNLPDTREQAPMSFTATVRRVDVTPDGWMVGAEFTGMREADRTRIVRYCWQKQRELHKAVEFSRAGR